MSHEGEKTCPLCAEEMDLTDQQLKPCKCGYEICVWCWHHIMDMAEKDAEGRCPACRTAYNKEKIVGTGAKCERLMVSEMNVDKKHKLHKGKNKTSEGRNQLGNVRVIQRNLVYVVGLPFDFADEDQLLQRRDYFGQYGKVLKVSLSRTASGAIQQFANSTCSVYITYSKEEEAVRCIQSVHGFVLDGRPLRACFGTTKYCHAWLRNMSCINPDCLYLHDIGSQEDSLTKDEIVSAYTRVQQTTSTSNSLQRRSGNVLPPPADEYCNNTAVSSGKPITKTATNTNQNSTSVSPPNSSSGRSAALPAGASWGTRLSTNQTLPTNTPCSDGPVRPKPDTSNGPVALCTSVASPSQVPSSRANIGKRFVHNDESIPQDKSKIKNSVKEQPNTNKSVPVPESSFAPTHSETLVINKQPNGPLLSEYPSNNISHPSATSIEPALQKGSNDALNGDVENMCSSILSMSIHENQQLQTSVEAENKTEEVQSDFRLGMPTSLKPVDSHEVENDLLSFESQRVNDPEIVTNRMQEFSNAFHLSKHSYHSADLNRQVVDRDSNLLVSEHNIPIRHSENMLNLAGIDNGGYSNIFPSNGTVNTGKSGIIADILSMDFDPWDDSLTSPTNLANFFGKSNRRGSFGAPGPKKTQHSNQSVFSFAREEQVSGFRQPVDYFEQAFKQPPTLHDFSGSNGVHIDKPVARDGFSGFNSTESEIFSNGHLSINKSAASRSQIAPPPGFPGPSRVPPPPGYTLQDRTEQILDMLPANHMHNSSPFSRNQYQTPLSSNTYSNGDIEFMDPAILAVGRGTLAGGVNNHYRLDMMSSFSPPQSSTYEETRFQSFLQRSLPSHQNQRFNDTGERFSSFGGDAYGHPSRVMDHALANNRSQFSQFGEAYGAQSRNGVTSNGQWDGWNEIQSGNINVRNDRLGFTNFYAGYEDPKRRMPNSGNLYNGAYGI